jgi:molybdenum cofactor guanylyltransferase
MPACQVRSIHAWVLSGGQGTRMGGQDKGLIPWQGQPMAWQVAQALSTQVGGLTVNANRNLDVYRAWPWPVCADDVDLPPGSGPLAGILTGLRHSPATWLQLWPCDSPQPPANLVSTLVAAAEAAQVDFAVPTTPALDGQPMRHHWTGTLVRTNQLGTLEALFHSGERRVRQWVTQGRWIGVSFARADAFININAPETWHAHR